MLRHKEEEEFRNLAMVPPNDHEILDSAFTIYENRLKEKSSLENFGLDRKGEITSKDKDPHLDY